MSPPSVKAHEVANEIRGWHLGLDIGSQNIRAVLFHQLSGKSYVIHWQTSAPITATPVPGTEEGASSATIRQELSPQLHWQLPTSVHIDLTGSLPNEPLTNVAITSPITGQPTLNFIPDDVPLQLPLPGLPKADGLLLQDLSLGLNIGLPYYSETSESPEPLLDWYLQPSPTPPQLTPSQPEQVPALPLRVVLRSLQLLLSTLKPEAGGPSSRTSAKEMPSHDSSWQNGSGWHCSSAQGLEPEQLNRILSNLEGVIVNTPNHCNEAYRFNLREVILAAQLVERPEQIACLEDPVASLLAEFHSHRPKDPTHNNPAQSTWQGATLVIHSNPTATELALTCLPSNLHNLSRDDIHLRSLAYGTQAYLQDIACQLLYPFIPEEQIDLDLAILPLPGEPDAGVRSQLQRKLHQSSTGSMLLEAAAHLNRVLQRQNRITFELGPHRSSFSQTALDTKVTQPFLLRLNREVNHLLSHTGLVSENISQVLCTGEGATQTAIQQWLSQKLPQARIITDTAPPTSPSSEQQGLPSISTSTSLSDLAPSFQTHRVAYGLTNLALYPQVLDRQNQQYSDYFLLMELLRCLPNEALTLGEILNHLEGQGINTQACQGKVLAILEGNLPSGLIPQTSDDVWVLESRHNPDYQSLEAPLFQIISEQAYQVDPTQRQNFLDYWQRITAHSYQKLEEPYILQVGLSLPESWAE